MEVFQVSGLSVVIRTPKRHFFNQNVVFWRITLHQKSVQGPTSRNYNIKNQKDAIT